MTDLSELQELEESMSREVRGIVDSAILRIMNKRMTRDEAVALVADVRRRVLEIFPGRGETFDLLYMRRFERTIEEFLREP
ncbi:MAG: hypothetical protein HY814_04970 [Candidatus Riflebacteria bacterium]|nr:hypothetical protein [Candidatus Riflebacteria bacterium]